MPTLTRIGIVLEALRDGPKTIDELFQHYGIKDPYTVIFLLRMNGYDIQTKRNFGERKSVYVLREN